MLKPWDQQEEAIQDLFGYFETHKVGNPCLLAPTAAGKSLIQAEFVKRALDQFPGQRIGCLTHVKELIEQNHAKFIDQAPHLDAGIYSAGLNARNTSNSVLFMGVQSVYEKARVLGWFDLILIDECHLIPKKGDGMYRTFLNECEAMNPRLRTIGMSATPYRLDSGSLTEGEGRIFTDLIESENLTVDAGLRDGWLCPLTTEPLIQTHLREHTAQVQKRGNEFVPGQLERAVNVPSLVRDAVGEMVRFGYARNCWLIFAAGAEHAHNIKVALQAYDIEAGVITQNTSNQDRTRMILEHKAGLLRVLINVRILTTGFDNPRIDLIADLAPTESVSLYVQKLGRGFRLHPSKTDCLVLDFAGNIEKHGAVNKIKPPPAKKESDGEGDPLVKTCPECGTLLYIQARQCSQCGEDLSEGMGGLKHDAKASTHSVIASSRKTVPFNRVVFRRHTKADKPDSVRVDYYAGMLRVASEWLCFDHGGRAAYKAQQWLKTYVVDFQGEMTTDEALEILDAITVEQIGFNYLIINDLGKFPEITDRGFEEHEEQTVAI